MDKIIEYITYNELGKCLENESMRFHTTMRVGGTAKLLYIPDSTENLVTTINYFKENNIKYFIMGRGSNLIFSDELIDMVVVKISKVIDFREIDEDEIVVGAGYALARLAKEVSKLGLSGLEFAGGIPGSVGGSIYMNAGAHTGEMASIIESVTAIDESGKVVVLHNVDCEFSYRHSIFQERNYVILSCVIKLQQADSAIVYKKMAGNLEYRKEMQPLELPSVGSTFRNPEGHHAGKLIEQSGLKGYRIGGAAVSEKHANFIVNMGDATASDILSLVKHVQKVVYEKTGILLQTEFVKVEPND